MTLMDRIIFKDFLNQSEEEQLSLITRIQELRTTALAESRIKKGGLTKSARKNLTKRGKLPKDHKAELSKEISKLTPGQLSKLKESYGL